MSALTLLKGAAVGFILWGAVQVMIATLDFLTKVGALHVI